MAHQAGTIGGFLPTKFGLNFAALPEENTPLDLSTSSDNSKNHIYIDLSNTARSKIDEKQMDCGKATSIEQSRYCGVLGKKKIAAMASSQYNRVVGSGLNPLRLTIRRTCHSHKIDGGEPNRRCTHQGESTAQNSDDTNRVASPEDACTEPCLVDASTSTAEEQSPAVLASGLCEPGTKVSLDSIVWLEVAGMLTVRTNWRGRAYIGSLVDASNQGFSAGCPDKAVTSALSLLSGSGSSHRVAKSGRPNSRLPYHHHHMHRQTLRSKRGRRRRSVVAASVTTRSAAAAAVTTSVEPMVVGPSPPPTTATVKREEVTALKPEEAETVRLEEAVPPSGDDDKRTFDCPLNGCETISDSIVSLRYHVSMGDHSHLGITGSPTPSAQDLSPGENVFSVYSSSAEAMRTWLTTKEPLSSVICEDNEPRVVVAQLDLEAQREILGLVDPEPRKPPSPAYSDISDGPLAVTSDSIYSPAPPLLDHEMPDSLNLGLVPKPRQFSIATQQPPVAVTPPTMPPPLVSPTLPRLRSVRSPDKSYIRRTRGERRGWSNLSSRLNTALHNRQPASMYNGLVTNYDFLYRNMH